MDIDEDELKRQVVERRQLRSDILIALYTATNGTAAPYGRARLHQLAEQHGWGVGDVDREAVFLKNTGHLEFVAAGDLVGLTAHGVDAVERALEPQEDVLQPIDAIELRAIESFAYELRTAIERQDVAAPPADLEEIRGLLETIERHLSARPRRKILRAVLQVTASLLLNIGGNFATDLARRIPTLL